MRCACLYLDLGAQLRAGLDLMAHEVAGGDGRDLEHGRDARGIRALAGAGRAQEHELERGALVRAEHASHHHDTRTLNSELQARLANHRTSHKKHQVYKTIDARFFQMGPVFVVSRVYRILFR